MKRSLYGIVGDILEEARTERRVSHLVYRCNLNFKIIRGYLMPLLEKGLLVQEGNFYRTTEKGLGFIRDLRALDAQLLS